MGPKGVPDTKIYRLTVSRKVTSTSVFTIRREATSSYRVEDMLLTRSSDDSEWPMLKYVSSS
jgi:hypothetical protein